MQGVLHALLDGTPFHNGVRLMPDEHVHLIMVVLCACISV